jgi:hypothetical protein
MLELNTVAVPLEDTTNTAVLSLNDALTASSHPSTTTTTTTIKHNVAMLLVYYRLAFSVHYHQH